MTFKAKRLIIVMAIGALLGLAVLLVLAALRENIVCLHAIRIKPIKQKFRSTNSHWRLSKR